MKKGKGKICALLCLTLISGGLAGCAKDKSGEGTSQQDKGGYVETELSLTQLGTDQTVKQIFSVEEKVHLLTAADADGVTIFREWEQEGESFCDVSGDWLSSLALDCETWVDMQLMQGDGVQYLFIRGVNEEGSYEGQLWRQNGSSAQNITPQKWTEPDEVWGTYEYILGMAVLNNGNLVAVSHSSIDVLSGEDGSVLESETVAADYGETVLTDGRSLYITTLSSSGGIGGIEKRPDGSSENAEQLSFPINGMDGAALCVMEDGTLIAGAAEGLFRYNIVTESWEKLLEGAETDFAMRNCWCVGMTALEDGRIFALFQQEDGGIRLVQYEYDPDAVKEVTQELKLYTVWENSLLQQAAVLYHKEHPDVLITVECAYSTEDRFSGMTPDYNQVYQNLNTMLMGDDAPDILVMDYLNLDSYAEKGLLVDLKDIVEPMEESGDLLSNITGAYKREDGSRYAVPLQFGFTMALGRQIKAEDMASLEALAKFLPEQKESYLGPLTAEELVDLFYPCFCGEIVKNNALDRDALGKRLESLKAIADNSGIIPFRQEDDRRYSSMDLPSRIRLALVEVKGYYNSMSPIAMMEYIGGDIAAYENCFVPYLVTGVNARSAYRDTALDFLAFALSQEVQDTDYHNGFPVNLLSLQKQETADRSNVIAVTVIETADGGQEMFEVVDYDLETAKRLTELCKGLKRPVVEDEKIRQELISALPGYLDGSRTLEQTLDSIEGGLRMYLAE